MGEGRKEERNLIVATYLPLTRLLRTPNTARHGAGDAGDMPGRLVPFSVSPRSSLSPWLAMVWTFRL